MSDSNVISIKGKQKTKVLTVQDRSKHTFRFPFLIDGSETSMDNVKWTIKNLLISGGLSVVYGPPKSGKSFVAIDAAYRVSHGIDFFGRKTDGGLVVYLCGEGQIGFRQRMTAWRQANNAEPTDNFVVMTAAINLLDDKDEIAALKADLSALSIAMNQPIKMIVIDTLAKYFGGGEEDKASEMNRFIASLSGIQVALENQSGENPHIMLVHHTGKNVSAGMRGSNALLGAADAAIEVTANDDGIRQCRIADIKDASSQSPFYFRLGSVEIGIDEDGDTIRTCAVKPAVLDGPFDAKPAKPARGRPASKSK